MPFACFWKFPVKFADTSELPFCASVGKDSRASAAKSRPILIRISKCLRCFFTGSSARAHTRSEEGPCIIFFGSDGQTTSVTEPARSRAIARTLRSSSALDGGGARRVARFAGKRWKFIYKVLEPFARTVHRATLRFLELGRKSRRGFSVRLARVGEGFGQAIG